MVSATTTNGRSVGDSEATIDILPDDALLNMFFLYKEGYSSDPSWWESLVHVCGRWRHLIFASPLRLNLRLLCTSGTPTSESLDIWPPFPIAIHFAPFGDHREIVVANVVAALEHRDRVTEIRFALRGTGFMRFYFRMLSPFSALTDLSLGSIDGRALVLPNLFLGGSAPSLRNLLLKSISFVKLPELLLSATQLVTLRLYSVPVLPYILPVTLATCFGVMPNLRQLEIEYQARFPLSDQPPLPTRVVLPSLTYLRFIGDSDNLEEHLAQIDAPILQTLSVTFRDHDVRIPQLLRFVNSAERLRPPIRVMLEFGFDMVLLKFMPSDSFEVAIICDNLAGQISSIALVCRELLPLLAHVERLDLHCTRLRPSTESTNPRHWLELFHPFINLQNLYVSWKVWPQVAPALRGLTGESATEVLPQLRTLFLEELEQFGQVWESIEPFIAARRLFDQPVAAQQCIALDFAEC